MHSILISFTIPLQTTATKRANATRSRTTLHLPLNFSCGIGVGYRDYAKFMSQNSASFWKSTDLGNYFRILNTASVWNRISVAEWFALNRIRRLIKNFLNVVYVRSNTKNLRMAHSVHLGVGHELRYWERGERVLRFIIEIISQRGYFLIIFGGM